MGWIKVTRGGRANFHEIPERGLVIGRNVESGLSLRDRSISRRHARIHRGRDRDEVEDLGSTNGTYVNDRKVARATALGEGDRLRFGDFEVVYFRNPPSSEELAAAAGPRDRQSVVDAPPVSASLPNPPSKPNPSPSPDEPATSMLPQRPLRRPFSSHRWMHLRLVGQGGMGEVYYAHDRDLAADVAIKRLRDRGDESRDLLARLHEREASIARTIRHPNVVQVLEDGVFDGDPFMVLEWVEGPTFDRYCVDPNVTPALRLECVRQIALGLAAAHDAGVVHADLKPANILIAESQQSRERAANLGILEAPDRADPVRDESRLELDEEIARRIGLPAQPDFDQVPCVGREAELAFLEQIAIDLVESGDAQRWIILYGERGVGKRRLCEEFRALSRASGRPVAIRVAEDGEPPEPGAQGLWISLFPPFLPDDPDLRRDYEAARLQGHLRELFVKPFLKGQSIRLVESIVHHRESARLFIERVEDEVGGNPALLLERLARSFADEAWSRVGTVYRLDAEALRPDSAAVIRRRLDQLQNEEKGLRDLLTEAAPLGSQLEYSVLRSISSLDEASLFYLVDHAVRVGYFMRVSPTRLEWTQPEFRRVLESRLDEKRRLELIRSALPSLRGALEQNPEAAGALLLETARLERTVGAPERAFRYLLRAALRARSEYDRTVFFESIDLAREIYRSHEKRRPRKGIAQALEQVLGESGRGLTALDRLRRLPTQVLARLTDFGIARRVDEGGEAEEDRPWGTPRYMSPEQARRERLTSASDVYSLGVILREVLEGRHPLGDLRGKEAVRALLARNEPTPLEPAVPTGLRNLVIEMLAHDSEQRPTAREVARHIQNHQLQTALREA